MIYTMESHGASIWKNRECVVIHTCYGPCGIAGESRLDWSLNLLRYLQVVEFVMRFQMYFNNLGDQEKFGIHHQSREDIMTLRFAKLPFTFHIFCCFYQRCNGGSFQEAEGTTRILFERLLNIDSLHLLGSKCSRFLILTNSVGRHVAL